MYYQRQSNPENLLLSEGNNDGNAVIALIIVVLTIVEGIIIAKTFIAFILRTSKINVINSKNANDSNKDMTAKRIVIKQTEITPEDFANRIFEVGQCENPSEQKVFRALSK